MGIKKIIIASIIIIVGFLGFSLYKKFSKDWEDTKEFLKPIQNIK